MVQNKILIAASSIKIAIRMAEAFNLYKNDCIILTEISHQSIWKIRGVRFDTVIVHESFKQFNTREHLLNLLETCKKPTTKLFYVEEDFPNV